MGSQNTTTTSTLSNTIKDFYDRLLLMVLDPATKFYQFAEKKPLPLGEGLTVIWNRPTRLSFGQKLTQGVRPSSNQLSTAKISAKIEQIGGYIEESDLVQMAAITDAMKLATERLAHQAAETVDQYIVESLVIHNDLPLATGGSAFHAVKTSGARIDISASRYLLRSAGGDVNGGRLIAVSDIRKMVGFLRARNVPTVDGMNYVGIIHPNVAEDMMADSTWQNYHQYTTPEFLYNGEIGRVQGVRFVETTLAPVIRGSANGLAISASGAVSALGYGTIIFGREFYGVTELDGGVKTYTVTGPTKEDPLNQKDTYGWKVNIAAQILNVSAGIFLWTGSGDTLVAASATSAAENGGVTVGANLWADASAMESRVILAT